MTWLVILCLVTSWRHVVRADHPMWRCLEARPVHSTGRGVVDCGPALLYSGHLKFVTQTLGGVAWNTSRDRQAAQLRLSHTAAAVVVAREALRLRSNVTASGDEIRDLSSMYNVLFPSMEHQFESLRQLLYRRWNAYRRIRSRINKAVSAHKNLKKVGRKIAQAKLKEISRFRKSRRKVYDSIRHIRQMHHGIIEHVRFCRGLEEDNKRHPACALSSYALTPDDVTNRTFASKRHVAEKDKKLAKLKLVEAQRYKILVMDHVSRLGNLSTLLSDSETSFVPHMLGFNRTIQYVESNVTQGQRILIRPRDFLRNMKNNVAKINSTMSTLPSEKTTISLKKSITSVASADKSFAICRDALLDIKVSLSPIVKAREKIIAHRPYIQHMHAGIVEEAAILTDILQRRIGHLYFPLLRSRGYLFVDGGLSNISAKIAAATEEASNTTLSIKELISTMEKSIDVAQRISSPTVREEAFSLINAPLEHYFSRNSFSFPETLRPESFGKYQADQNVINYSLYKNFKDDGLLLSPHIRKVKGKRRRRRRKRLKRKKNSRVKDVHDRMQADWNWWGSDDDEQETATIATTVTITTSVTTTAEITTAEATTADTTMTSTGTELTTEAELSEMVTSDVTELIQTSEQDLTTSLTQDSLLSSTHLMTLPSKTELSLTFGSSTGEEIESSSAIPVTDDYEYYYEYYYDDDDDETTSTTIVSTRLSSSISSTLKPTTLSTKLASTATTDAKSMTFTPTEKSTYEETATVTEMSTTTAKTTTKITKTTTTTTTTPSTTTSTTSTSTTKEPEDDYWDTYDTDDYGVNEVDVIAISSQTTSATLLTTQDIAEETDDLGSGDDVEQRPTTTPRPLSSMEVLVKKLQLSIARAATLNTAMYFKANRLLSFSAPELRDRMDLVTANVSLVSKGVAFLESSMGSTLPVPVPTARYSLHQLHNTIGKADRMEKVGKAASTLHQTVMEGVNGTDVRVQDIRVMVASTLAPLTGGGVSGLSRRLQEVTSLEQGLLVNSKKVNTIGNSIQSSIATLRLKVEKANELARLIQPSFEVKSPTNYSFYIPASARPLGSPVDSVALEVRTESKGGVLLTLSDSPRPYSNRTGERTVRLTLSRGKPYLALVEDDVTTRATTGRVINDGLWHRIKIVRYSNLLELWELASHVDDPRYNVTCALHLPDSHRFRPLPAYLLFGGSLRKTARRGSRVTGCVKNMHVNERPLRLSAHARNASTAAPGCCLDDEELLEDLRKLRLGPAEFTRDRCVDPYHQRHYVRNLDANLNILGLSFRTNQDPAMLVLYQAYPRDAFQLAVYQNAVMLEGRVDHDVFRDFCKSDAVTDGTWHHLIVTISQTSTEVYLDGKLCMKFSLAVIATSGHVHALSLYADPGAVDKRVRERLPSRMVFNAMKGHIKNLVFNDERVPVNLRSCPVIK